MIHHHQLNESDEIAGCYYPALILFVIMTLGSAVCALAGIASVLPH